MTERIFLDDGGTLFSTTALGQARLWRLENLRGEELPPLIYVMESMAGEELLLGREVCGRPKFNMIRSLARTFGELFSEMLRGRDLAQYLILRGAYPFDLQHAFASLPPYDRWLLPTAFIKLQRVLNPEGSDWEIQSRGLIGEYRGDVWLIPETAIASGSTIAYFLRTGFAVHRPRQVYVLTACGSLEGIGRIHRVCREAGVELIPVFSQCAFEVSQRGNLPGLPLTDLSILTPGSITLRSTVEKAVSRYQGTRMCCVGDVGESLEDPIQYAIHTLWEMQVLGMDPVREDWGRWTVDVRTPDMREKVAAFNPVLSEYFKGLWKDGA
jgi:hypothetical protein